GRRGFAASGGLPPAAINGEGQQLAKARERSQCAHHSQGDGREQAAPRDNVEGDVLLLETAVPHGAEEAPQRHVAVAEKRVAALGEELLRKDQMGPREPRRVLDEATPG